MIPRREFARRLAAGAAALSCPVLHRHSQAAAEPSNEESPSRAAGPLRICSENPRYFAGPDGKAVYLCGSHVWNNLVDMGPTDPPPAFDFEAYLGFLQKYDHNFIRLWTWEHVTWDTSANGGWGKPRPHHVAPHPWARTGPGMARDGKPRFDLTRFDDRYFRRLRERVMAAGERGIYVSVMLFEGWAMQRMKRAWESHPFHPANNINGLDGDANHDGNGLEIHTLAQPQVTRLQESYVRKVIDTVGDLPNVLYEISNENHPGSTEWQYHMIRFVKNVEQKRRHQHPVGMTFQFRGGRNSTLFDSPADWISPNADGGYRDDPPAADGKKVILADTDHLWGIGGNRQWAWKSFLRGLNPIFMDPYDGAVLAKPFDPRWEPIRLALGYTRHWARQLDVTRLRPRGDLASSGYCLADPGRVYLAYAPGGAAIRIDLSDAQTPLEVTWIDTTTGRSHSKRARTKAARVELTPPVRKDWVVLIQARRK